MQQQRKQLLSQQQQMQMLQSFRSAFVSSDYNGRY
jgi:hypothetical protein